MTADSIPVLILLPFIVIALCFWVLHLLKCWRSFPASPPQETRYALPITEVPLAEGAVQALLIARCQRCDVGETIWMNTLVRWPTTDYVGVFYPSNPMTTLTDKGYRYFEGNLLCPICWQNACEIVLGSEATQGKGVTT